MKTISLLVLLLIVLQASLHAGEYRSGKHDTTSDSLQTTVYIELGGKFFPSVNLDFRRSRNMAWGLGLGMWWDAEENPQTLFIPSLSASRFFGKKKRLETGGGVGAFLGTYSGFASAMVFSHFGYRYQKKQGLFFRAAFTPFVGFPVRGRSRFMAIPWLGVGLGYTF